MPRYLLLAILLAPAALFAADKTAADKPSASAPSTLPSGHYLCAVGVADVEGSYLDTRDVSLTREHDAVTADTRKGMRLTGKLVEDRLYLLGSEIDDSGLEVIQVVAHVEGEIASGDFVRSLDGRVIARGTFIMRRAESGS